jgi:drug/metabolite transporter (DMT)-like permease
VDRRIVATAVGTRRQAFGGVEWTLLVAVAAMWGGAYLLVAYALAGFSPALIALLRLALGAAALVCIPQARRPIAVQDWPAVILLGLTWMAAPFLLFNVAQQHIESSLAGVINGALPLFAALTAALLLRRAPRAIQVLGLVVGFIGVLVVTLPAASGARATAFGVALAVLATALYGFATNLAVPLQQRYGALPVILRSEIASLVVLLPYGSVGLAHVQFSWASFMSIVGLGIFSTGIAYVAMTTLVGRAGAVRGAVAIYFIPIVALVLGTSFRGESVRPSSLVGVLIILGGAFIVSRPERDSGLPRTEGTSH